MLKLIDIFKNRDNAEYYGILDETTNIINYVTYYDLQKKYHDTPLDIEGVKHTNLNSIGLKIVLSDKFKVLLDKNKEYKLYGIKPCVDYYKLEDYVVKNIPFGYRILKDNILYTYQNSSRMGLCWRACLFPLYTFDKTVVKVEKMILGHPVLDFSYFFVDTEPCKVDIPTTFYSKANNLSLDFTNLDFKGIQDISYFLSGFPFDVELPNFNIDDVLYCKNAFYSIDSDRDFQVIDISNCNAEPFILFDDDVFIRGSFVQLFLIGNSKWLLNRLSAVEATTLGSYTRKICFNEKTF